MILRRLNWKWSFLLLLFLLVFQSCKSKEDAPSSRSSASNNTGRPGIEILFTYGSEKQKWVEEVTAEFNRRSFRTNKGKSIQVNAVPMGSGECIDGILSGVRKAHLTSPASAAFIRLGNAESRAKTGKDLIGPTENLVLSPIVIAMWKPMAEAIGWGKKPVGWSEILSLARDNRGWSAFGFPQWGSFKFGHTNPEFSNSGLMSLFAEVYAAANKVSALTLSDVEREETGEYLSGIEQAVVHYGSSTGFFGRKMFENGPEYLSAAVLYENMVIESYSNRLPFPVISIYPKEGTFWSDHPAGIVEREWVTPEHREAAGIYTKYLLEVDQQKKAMAYGFRPASVEVILTAPIDAAHGVDPKEPKTTLEVPSVEVINAILESWRRNKKHANVVLVLDVSGSMKEENKMENAKAGAEQLVSMLQREDFFSLVPFNSKPTWALKSANVGESKTTADQTIQSLFPSGGTALYDSIGVAYQFIMDQPKADRISAIVVLSDGEDTNSRTTLKDLLQRVRYDGETKVIRIFTIGYGSGAKSDVLKQIADSTQARFYEGKPDNIREVFKEISTFF